MPGSGRSRGGAWAPAPLFLDQNEARRAEKRFLRPPTPPIPYLSQGLDDWASAFSEGVDTPLPRKQKNNT